MISSCFPYIVFEKFARYLRTVNLGHYHKWYPVCRLIIITCNDSAILDILLIHNPYLSIMHFPETLTKRQIEQRQMIEEKNTNWKLNENLNIKLVSPHSRAQTFIYHLVWVSQMPSSFKTNLLHTHSFSLSLSTHTLSLSLYTHTQSLSLTRIYSVQNVRVECFLDEVWSEWLAFDLSAEYVRSSGTGSSFWDKQFWNKERK